MAIVSKDQIESLAEQITRVASPQQVILFGSQARGTAHADSDVDLLIVGDKPPGEAWSRRREIGRIRRALPLPGVSIDILFFTPEEIEKWRHTTNHVISQALREGRVLYERPRACESTASDGQERS
jgi:predicted nucleotidyltransferase